MFAKLCSNLFFFFFILCLAGWVVFFFFPQNSAAAPSKGFSQTSTRSTVHITTWATVVDVSFPLHGSVLFNYVLSSALPPSFPENLKSITNEFRFKASTDLTSFLSQNPERNSLAVDLRAEAMWNSARVRLVRAPWRSCTPRPGGNYWTAVIKGVQRCVASTGLATLSFRFDWLVYLDHPVIWTSVFWKPFSLISQEMTSALRRGRISPMRS